MLFHCLQQCVKYTDYTYTVLTKYWASRHGPFCSLCYDKNLHHWDPSRPSSAKPTFFLLFSVHRCTLPLLLSCALSQTHIWCLSEQFGIWLSFLKFMCWCMRNHPGESESTLWDLPNLHLQHTNCWVTSHLRDVKRSIRNVQPTLTTDFLHSPTGPHTLSTLWS